MATPYISLLSKRSISEQIQRYYDQENLIYNVEDIVKAQTTEYTNTLREVSREQCEIMKAGTEAICGTLENGFDLISDGLQGVENAVYHLTDTLDTHLKMMIDEQRYNNILSENIALLLKVANSQKERQLNIEKGLKFFNDSLRDPSFFEYSLKFFENAIKDDDTDYFVLDKIGLIYLCSKQHKNYDEAIKHFTKAVKFSKVDTHPSSIRLANILVGDVTRPLKNQTTTIDYIKYITGQSLLWISIAYYEQGKFPEAIKFGQEASQMAPTLLDAGFHLAKSLAANNQNKNAAEVLEPVIRQNRDYSLKTLSDIDLAPKIEIKNTLENLRQEVYNEASRRVANCKSNILSQSKGSDLLNKIESLTNDKSYLACKKAIDLLNEKNSYAFNNAIEKNGSGKWQAEIKPMNFNFTIEELIDYENVLRTKIGDVKTLIEKKNLLSKLQSELSQTKYKFSNTSTELNEVRKESRWVTNVLLAGLGGTIVGIIILAQGMNGFFSALLWLLALAITIIGILAFFISLFALLGGKVKGMTLSSKTNKISTQEQKQFDNIKEIESEIQQLENS